MSEPTRCNWQTFGPGGPLASATEVCVACGSVNRERCGAVSEPTMQEAREDVTMCYHPTNFSEAEFLERLDAFAAAVRRETLNEVRAMVTGLCKLVPSAHGGEDLGTYVDMDDILTELTQLEARDGRE